MWWGEGILCVALCGGLCGAATLLRPLSWTPLPDNKSVFGPFKGTADRAAWDDQHAFLYVIGTAAQTLHILDVHSHFTPTVIHSQAFDPILDGIPTAIAFCRGPNTEELVVAFSSRDRLNAAYVEIFKPFLRNDPTFIRTDRVLLDGTDPSQVKFDKNCFHFAVTTEGLPGLRGTTMEDPTPHLDVFRKITDGWHRTTTNFQNAHNLERARYIYKGDNLASHNRLFDLEPSDIFVGQDNTVYVNFHENNAVAKVTLNDLDLPAQFHSLGVKNWQDHDIDTSDKDTTVSPGNNNINMVRRNIRSFYQPKALHGLVFKNKTYLITANTGGVKKYKADVEGVDFEEAKRAKLMGDTLFDPSLDSATKQQLKQDTELGRLYVSNVRDATDGWDNLFKFYRHAHAYGGRSWSIWDSDDMTQVYDSGDGLEYEAGQYNKSVFNGDCFSTSMSPPQHLDTRSDDMGCEPNAIATGEHNGSTIVVVGSGRMGGMWLYKVTESEGKPKGVFQSYTRLGELGGNWKSLYQSKTAGVQYINDLLFVTHHNNHEMVIAIGSQMGAIAIFEVIDGDFP